MDILHREVFFGKDRKDIDYETRNYQKFFFTNDLFRQVVKDAASLPPPLASICEEPRPPTYGSDFGKREKVPTTDRLDRPSGGSSDRATDRRRRPTQKRGWERLAKFSPVDAIFHGNYFFKVPHFSV